MIKLQILLQRPWRNPEGVKRVRELAEELGIKPTAEGRTTISAEVTRDDFEEIFRAPVQELEPRPPGDEDFGSPGGHVSGELPIPESLRDYVMSISVASPYLRM